MVTGEHPLPVLAWRQVAPPIFLFTVNMAIKRQQHMTRVKDVHYHVSARPGRHDDPWRPCGARLPIDQTVRPKSLTAFRRPTFSRSFSAMVAASNQVAASPTSSNG